jgi:UDP-GlcNAc:undecaprenyl-phosphate GlcNAc-1-phosphate transferase
MFHASFLAVPLAAFLIGLCAIGTIRRIALALGFVDNPDRWRKLHEAPIPLGGGLAVWLATWSGWNIGRLVPPDTGAAGDAGWFLVALAIASLVVLGVGVIDDWRGLRARYKLAGQLVAALILVGLGLRVDTWSCFGVAVQPGLFAAPITVLWILLVVNAFNLIDGMDGFCGCLGLVAALAIAFLGYSSGQVPETVMGLALAGALVAFLRDNLPPAKVFLGDAGSLTVGMMIAALSVRVCSDGPGTAVSIPLLAALLILPLLDIVTAICRRWLTGHSIFAPDRGHIHHCLGSRLGSTAAALVVAIGLATLGAGGAALAKASGMGDLGAGLAIVTAVALLTGTNTFRAFEMRLLVFRVRTALIRLLARGPLRRGSARRERHLRGSRDWAGVWQGLVRELEEGGARRVELVIDMTAAGEVYYGLWSSPTGWRAGSRWTALQTLYAGDAPSALLRVAGRGDASRSRYLDQREGLVRMLEGHLNPGAAPAPADPLSAPACVNLSATAPLS